MNDNAHSEIKKIKFLFSISSILSIFSVAWHILNLISSTKKYVQNSAKGGWVFIEVMIILFVLCQAIILFFIFKLSLSSEQLRKAIVVKRSGKRYKSFQFYAFISTLLYLSSFILNIIRASLHNSRTDAVSIMLIIVTVFNFILLLSAKKIIQTIKNDKSSHPSLL